MNKPEAGGAHYGKVDPFTIIRVMSTSGNAFVDFCRGNIIKYAHRKKGETVKMIDDLKKAAHYATEAANALQAELDAAKGPQLPFAETLAQKFAPRCTCGSFMPPHDPGCPAK